MPIRVGQEFVSMGRAAGVRAVSAAQVTGVEQLGRPATAAERAVVRTGLEEEYRGAGVPRHDAGLGGARASGSDIRT